MARIDREAQERFSIPEIVLMEDAGCGIYAVLREKIWKSGPPSGPVVFLAGKGNNGGDALVVARLCRLAGMSRLAVILGSGEPETKSLAGVHLRICRSLGIDVIDYGVQTRQAHRLMSEAQWLVDGLLGTGLTGPVRSPLEELIQRGNRVAALRIALDIPSGIGDAFRKGNTAFQADYTLTVELPKLCLYLPNTRRFCGDVYLVRGVFPPELVDHEDIPGQMITGLIKQHLLRPLAPDSHKGQRGHLAVFAGSEGTTGAAWLCSTSAARSRAGLVTLFLDRSLYAGNIPKYSSVMLHPWDGDLPDLKKFDALLVGPGWGLSEQRERCLEQLFDARIQGVLDADGISLLATLRKKRRVKLGGAWILTPHPGEFSRLLDMDTAAVLDDPLPALLRASAELEAVIILKGHCSIVACPDGGYGVLDGMNAAMATGGSGDVLAGICAGLLSSGHESENAANLAVLLHSEIGKQLYRDKGYFLAEDMVASISSICKVESGESQP
jgi:NAD(P)H-hydrate epimerase